MVAISISKLALALPLIAVSLHTAHGKESVPKTTKGGVVGVAPAIQAQSTPKQLSPEDYWKPWDAWLKHKGSPISGADVWTASQEARVKGEVLICITGAETNYGKVAQRGSTTNVGSVGSYDQTNTTHTAHSVLDGLRMIGRTLDNDKLGKKTTIGQLSRKSEPFGPVYAESTYNWETNMISCLSDITGQPVTNQFEFRVK